MVQYRDNLDLYTACICYNTEMFLPQYINGVHVSVKITMFHSNVERIYNFCLLTAFRQNHPHSVRYPLNANKMIQFIHTPRYSS